MRSHVLELAHAHCPLTGPIHFQNNILILQVKNRKLLLFDLSFPLIEAVRQPPHFIFEGQQLVLLDPLPALHSSSVALVHTLLALNVCNELLVLQSIMLLLDFLGLEVLVLCVHEHGLAHLKRLREVLLHVDQLVLEDHVILSGLFATISSCECISVCPLRGHGRRRGLPYISELGGRSNWGTCILRIV